MKKNIIPSLKIYHLSQPLLSTEWVSLLGDKFVNALPFKWDIVDDINFADVVTWDGVITKKQKHLMASVLPALIEKKYFIIHGEAKTLFQNNPLVEVVDFEKLRYVELSGWAVMPEEILAAIEHCHQKLHHV